MPANLSAWKQKIVAFAGGLGAPGLFLISFLDSSVLTFPVINDLLLIELSIQHPVRMPLYALMASLGSLLGCVLLFFIAQSERLRLEGHAANRARARMILLDLRMHRACVSRGRHESRPTHGVVTTAAVEIRAECL